MRQSEKMFMDAQKQHRSGNLVYARKMYERILQQEPHHGNSRLYLAIILFQEGKVRDALAHAHRAMEDTPNPDVQMLSNYGVLLKNTGSIEKAAQVYRQALDIDPNSQGTKSNLATLYMLLGKLDDAEHMFLDLTRTLEEAAPWVNIARIALARKDWDKCERCLKSASDIDPTHPGIHLLRANLYMQLKDEEKAYSSIKKALSCNPGNPEGWLLLQSLGQSFINYEDVEHFLGILVETRVQSSYILCAAVDIARKNLLWKHLPALEMLLADALTKPLDKVPSVAATFTLLGANVSQRCHLNSASATWNRLTQGITRLKSPAPQPKEDVLRVGFLSSDFRGHALGFNIVGVMEQLPKGRIEWFAYNNSFDDGEEVRERIRSGFDRFINVAKLSDAELAERIREDGIDVLIDLNGMIAETRVRVMAYRPAPVSMTWLGMPGSVGAGADIDYVICDKWVTYEGNADGFSECLAQLPRSYLPNDHIPPDLSLAGTRADHSLPEDAVVFCSFNQHYKMSPDTIALWGRILNEVPESVLWLLDPATNALREGWKRALARHGIDASRLIFAPKIPQRAHIARISHADLVLDTLPYNAHATCSDALRVGTPVLTLPGKTFAGRVAASILDTGDLQEWIAATPEEYIQKAVSWASQAREAIQAAKQSVFRRYWASSMMDNGAFGKQLEALCLHVYDRAASGLAPSSLRMDLDLTVTPLPFGRQADEAVQSSTSGEESKNQELIEQNSTVDYTLRHGGNNARMHNLRVLQKTVLELRQPPLLVEVGSPGRGWSGQVVTPLADNEILSIHGFEQDEDRFTRLQTGAHPNRRYENIVIGDGSEGQMYVCKGMDTNSLYMPNAAVQDFLGVKKSVIERVVPTQTWRLDDLDAVKSASMLKLNVNGTELDILQNAASLFSEVVLLQVTSSPLPLNTGQSTLFGIGAFLETHGYVLHSFVNETKVSYVNGISHAVNLPKSQVLDMDAVFIPSPARWMQLSSSHLLSLSFLMHSLYRAIDASSALLHTHDTLYATTYLSKYEKYLDVSGFDS